MHIQFCEPGRWKGSKNLQKQLVVEVPQGYVLPKLEVDQVSGNVRSSVLAMELDVETVSGEAILYNAQERADINVDAVSGNVKIDGTAASAEIDVETVSGSVKITCAAAAREIDLETVSGNMALNLPSAAGFRSEYSTISGKFSCGFNGQLQSNVFTYGSTPQTRILASSVSGDLEIMPNE